MVKRIKAGFTIVEMLMVIAVLAVLTGIVGTAASSAVRQARNRRADALRNLVQVGISTYYAQKGYWPPRGGKLQNWADSGVPSSVKNDAETDYRTGRAKKAAPRLEDSEYDKMMQELVKVSMKGSGAVPVMDPTGLIVTTAKSSGKKNGSGQEFREAVKKHKKHGSTLSLNEMVFGYQESHGWFRRFHVYYNEESDSVTVELQP